MQLFNKSLTNVDFFALIFPLIISFFRMDSSAVKDRSYFKRTILTMYFITVLSLGFVNKLYILFILIIIYPIVGGISLIISNHDFGMEKELKVHQFLIYHLFKWVFYIRFDIFTYYLFSLYFVINFRMTTDETINITTPVFITVIFLCWHIIISGKDQFNVKSFSTSYKTLKTQHKGNSTLYKKIKLVSTLIFIEDRYFFYRSKPFFSIADVYHTFKHKILNLYYRYKNKKGIESKLRILKQNIFKRSFDFILKRIRGYSTIEQQVIRTIAVGENSFRYKIRRKIFVEYIYNYFLCCAIVNQRLLFYKKENIPKRKLVKLLKEDYRYNLLIYYYENILNAPKNINDLTKSLSKESRVSKNIYDRNILPYMDDNFISLISDEINLKQNIPYCIYSKK